LKRQEKKANEEAEALRKEFAQETENLVIQAGAAKASSTNLVNTVSIPVSTASPNEGLSLSDSTNPEQDDSEIPPFEDIYQNYSNGDPTSAVQTKSKVNKSSGAHAFVSYDKTKEALEVASWVDAMQEELAAAVQYTKICDPCKFAFLVRKHIGTIVEFIEIKRMRSGVVVKKQSKSRFQMIQMESSHFLSMDFTIKQKEEGIFNQSGESKDEEGRDVDVHLNSSMISSLMYLTALGLKLCLQSVLVQWF
ncbi:hypothetical protein Tco_1305223, partial [Tanacetum coccineum]